MPNAEWMKSVMEGPTNLSAEPVEGQMTVDEALDSEEVADDSTEVVEDEDDQEADGDDAEAAESEDEDAPEGDESDADEEPEASHEEGEQLIFGRYRSMEEAEKGFEETRRFAFEKSQTAAEREKEVAHWRAIAEERSRQGGDEPGNFEDWAEAAIEQNAEAGLSEAVRAYRDTDNVEWVYGYLRKWAETDPYEASSWRIRFENTLHNVQEQQPYVPPEVPLPPPDVSQPVINETWIALADSIPDLKQAEVIDGTLQVLKEDPLLNRAVKSADPQQVARAIELARSEYRNRIRGARPDNGSPRKARQSDVEQVRKDKLAATVSTGDGAPSRRPSSPDLSPEEQMIFDGAAKMGLKLRET